MDMYRNARIWIDSVAFCLFKFNSVQDMHFNRFFGFNLDLIYNGTVEAKSSLIVNIFRKHYDIVAGYEISWTNTEEERLLKVEKKLLKKI